MNRSRSRAAAAPLPWIRISVLLTIWVALFSYAGRPLLVAAHAGGIAPAVAWSLLAVLSATPLLPFLLRGHDARHHNAIHWVGYVTLALFTMMFVLVVMTDIARLALAILRVTAAAAPIPRFDPVITSFAVLGAAVLLTFVGAAQAHCPSIRRVRVNVEELPADLDGYRIVQWSDVHVGPSIRRRFIQSLVDRTNALQPDAIAITGDFIDGNFADVRDQLEPLRELQTRDGAYYVTGNHEYYWSATSWLHELASFGLVFLRNEHRIVNRGSASIAFAGVTDPVGRGAHRQDVPAAVDDIPSSTTTVLLSHRPQTAEEASRLGVTLQLSGHTHGGQFFPFNLVIHWFQPIVAGLHRVGSAWLYVSRGTGYWGPPSRLGVGSEITVIELRRA
jgi:predicted MPP superfamily phosphohydrolase